MLAPTVRIERDVDHIRDALRKVQRVPNWEYQRHKLEIVKTVKVRILVLSQSLRITRQVPIEHARACCETMCFPARRHLCGRLPVINTDHCTATENASQGRKRSVWVDQRLCEVSPCVFRALLFSGFVVWWPRFSACSLLALPNPHTLYPALRSRVYQGHSPLHSARLAASSRIRRAMHTSQIRDTIRLGK
jgi:hypothetical protein